MPSQHILFDEHSDVNSVFSSSRTSDKGSLLHHKNSFAISPQDCAVAAPQRQDLTLVPSCAGSQLNTCCLRTPWLGDARPQDRRRTNGQRAKNQHLLTLPAPGLPHRNFKTKTSFPSVVKKKKKLFARVVTDLFSGGAQLLSWDARAVAAFRKEAPKKKKAKSSHVRNLKVLNHGSGSAISRLNVGVS